MAAKSSNIELNFLLSKSGIFEYADPRTEQYYTIIKKANSHMFGQDVNVVCRVCRLHNSVNASSIPSNDALFEVFDFKFEGKMTLSETCHTNGTLSTENRTIFSYAKIKLPLVCNIRSEKINYDSIKFNSNKPEEIHVLQH